MMPDVSEAERIFQHSAQNRPKKLVLVSSALIYGTGTARQSLVTEDYSAPGYGRHRISSPWKSLEASAQHHLTGNVPLTILRPVTVPPSPPLFSRPLVPQLPPP